MLTIRKAQMRALGEMVLKEFENYLVAHVQKDFGEQLKGTPEDAVRTLIRKGILDAERYGIQRECDVERYIDLMFLLGPDFDASEESRWAGELLNNDTMLPLERLNRIYYRMEEHQ